MSYYGFEICHSFYVKKVLKPQISAKKHQKLPKIGLKLVENERANVLSERPKAIKTKTAKSNIKPVSILFNIYVK